MPKAWSWVIKKSLWHISSASVMRWIMPPPFVCWNSSPPGSQNVAVLGQRVFKEVIKLKEAVEVDLIQGDWCLYIWRTKRRPGMCTQREKAMWGGKGGCLQARKRPQKKPSLLTLWSWASRFQNCEKINFCCLSHPVFGILLWRS